MKKYLIVALFLFLFAGLLLSLKQPVITEPVWAIRSIDTTKFSRDYAREGLNDPQFDIVIASQVNKIGSVGASHVALGTPYDSEFKPFLERWIKAARKKRVKVWFRGNLSGWEEWFGYAKIDKKTHIQKIESFILENPDLFEDGDIFTPCPECENGALGDPRLTGDVEEYRQFLIDEYNVSQEAFGKIGKKVTVGYFSMNYDVANLIMDKKTTERLGNVVSIDHYIDSPKQFIFDVDAIAKRSGGKVIIGEFGMPIPDIHGTNVSEEEQEQWVREVLDGLVFNPNVIGVNYWTGWGGSTALWKQDGTPKKVVQTIKQYYLLKRNLTI